MKSSKPIVQINKNYRASVDNKNYTLEKRNLITDKKTKEKKESWVFQGYYTSFESLFKSLWKIELTKKIKNKTVELQTFVEIAKEVKNEIHKILKDFI